jgi:hypothetical protein
MANFSTSAGSKPRLGRVAEFSRSWAASYSIFHPYIHFSTLYANIQYSELPIFDERICILIPRESGKVGNASLLGGRRKFLDTLSTCFLEF